MKYLSKPYQIRLSFRCEKAWVYLQKHKVKPGSYLREGGEKAVIDKANEFYMQEKRDKKYPNAPDWVFG